MSTSAMGTKVLTAFTFSCFFSTYRTDVIIHDLPWQGGHCYDPSSHCSFSSTNETQTS